MSLWSTSFVGAGEQRKARATYSLSFCWFLIYANGRFFVREALRGVKKKSPGIFMLLYFMWKSQSPHKAQQRQERKKIKPKRIKFYYDLKISSIYLAKSWEDEAAKRQTFRAANVRRRKIIIPVPPFNSPRREKLKRISACSSIPIFVCFIFPCGRLADQKKRMWQQWRREIW